MVHRLEGQHLAAFREQGLDLREGSAGPGGDHHLGRLVEGDPSQTKGREGGFVLGGAADRGLGSPADEPHRL